MDRISSIMPSWLHTVLINIVSNFLFNATEPTSLDDDLSESSAGPLTAEPSVFSHVEQGLRDNPHSIAMLSTHQSRNHWAGVVSGDNTQPVQGLGDHNCLALTYDELHRTALKLGAGLLSRRVRPGSTVLMAIPNGGEYCILLWTCIVMRLTFVCLDPSTLEKGSSEFQRVVASTKSSVIVVSFQADAQVATTAARELGQDVLVMTLEDGASHDIPSFRSLIANGGKHPCNEDELLHKARNDDPTRTHSIMFTSGTSGTAKGCPMTVQGTSHMLTSQSWLINPENCAAALQHAHNSRGIAPAQTLQTWKAGGAVVLTGRGFCVEDMLEAIARHRVTFIVLTPPMVHALEVELSSREIDVNSVKSVQIGGDAVTMSTFIKCTALFPNAKVFINHGMTEGGGAFKWPFFQTPITEIPFFGEVSPVGRVAPGARVRIQDAGKGVVRRGQAGELHIQCGSLIPGYLDGVSQASFFEDEKGRWFNTGDVGMIDSNGIVLILGRKRDMITRNGRIIVPAVLETCISAFVKSQTVIVAIPTSEFGQEHWAVIATIKDRTQSEIKAHVRSHLGAAYDLGGVVTLDQLGLDEFPVNATHKIATNVIRERVEEYQGWEE